MADKIKLIVGLGNPGIQYQATRHNLGFYAVEKLAQDSQSLLKLDSKFRGLIGNLSMAGTAVWLLLPQTYMNLSGESVGAVSRFFKISTSAILVVHDELDFPPGIIRLKKGGRANGHNGLQSVIDHLEDDGFWRVRIGIGRPQPAQDLSKYVLAVPAKVENKLISEAVDSYISKELPKIIANPLLPA